MPRSARMVIEGEVAAYHIVSRTALDNYPFGDIEKDELLKIIKRFSVLYFAEVYGYSLMGNHFHLLVKMIPGDNYSDKEIVKRYQRFMATRVKKKNTDNNPANTNDKENKKDTLFPKLSPEQIQQLREKLSNLSEYIKEIKQTFSRYYNKRHGRRGTLWGERFKSLIVENGETLINCLAYIDLNPVRAKLVERPEDYRWNSIAYHIQTDNKDDFLSLDFGLKEFGVIGKNERIRRYRRYVYEAGAIEHPQKQKGQVIDEKIVEKERKKNFKITRIDRFQSRTRYFTDSGIIGSKEFVYQNYLSFKHLFQSKEKKPKPIKGLKGMYSLKRLAET